MGKILTETDLRSHPLPENTTSYTVAEDVFVTESARAYLDKRNIRLVRGTPAPAQGGPAVMSRTPVEKRGNRTFVEARTGRGWQEKPEEMTHLRGNLLVPKTHPRIAFRGKLDTLEALTLECQALAARAGKPGLADSLGEVLEHTRLVLGAEVKDQPLEERTLFGLGQEEVRRVSHNVKEYLGIQHPIPEWGMGELALRLNTLRTQVRETELAAATAFEAPGEKPRPDIIRELNRLSSGVYILFCGLLAGKE